ncbi:hypothetical protein [Nostoc sp. UHCC 0251]|uniref:hypothetical protein n=1 Tax=Nostoc sp. UHCC 0251 TaxID=3110240 RepID=UPI002B1EE262|nr:hypothetical protein [Nostoc sp. UHCC 0251]MEA5624181.1 hypothetical protein [Nostoc sp. UHCC 0251]
MKALHPCQESPSISRGKCQFWFDRVTMELQGFYLLDGKYQKIQPTTDGRLWSQQLELNLGVYEGKLRFFTTENQLILSF